MVLNLPAFFLSNKQIKYSKLMKHTKSKIIHTVLMIVCMNAVASFGQVKEGRSLEEKVKMKVERLDKKLQLSDSQKTQLTNLFVDQINEQKRNKEKLNSEIKSILSQDQYNQFLAIRADKKGKRHKKRKEFGRLQQMKEELNLTEDQLEKLRVVFDEARVELQTIRSKNLSKEDEMKARKEMKRKKRLKVKEILTEEQRKKLRELKRKK